VEDNHKDNETLKSEDASNKQVFSDEDNKFLEDLYKGKSMYKKEHEDFSKSVNGYFGDKWQQLKKNDDILPIIENTNNLTKGVSNFIDSVERFDTNDFLRGWYKKEYQSEKSAKNDKEKNRDSNPKP